MQLDQVTETIAHFIGVFNVQIEKARARESYDEFQALRESEEELPELPDINIRLVVPYELLNWDPNLKYKGPEVDIYKSEMHLDPDFGPGEFPLDVPLIFDDPGFRFYDGFGGSVYISGRAAPPELQPPGSMALVVKQSGYLEDNDYLNTTNINVDYIPITHFDYEVDLLLSRFSGVDLIGTAAPPSSEDAIADIIEGIAQSVRDMVPEDSAPEGTSIFTGSEIGGMHVNGVAGAEAPVISDYFTEPEIVEEPAAASSVAGEGLVEFEHSTTVEAGSNLLINEVLLANNWIVSPVFAVSGNSVTLNVISQINIWSDSDSVDAQFANWQSPETSATQGFNIASFTGEKTTSEDETTSDELPEFPSFWTVTTLDTNLVFLNWVEQVNFISDHDVNILSASGKSTLMTVGDNLLTNAVNLGALGYQYDLIVVAGDMYQANVISQANILLDNDYLSAIGGFGTEGAANASLNGNLLWNQANIHTVGQTQFAGMSAEYLEAAAGLAKGDSSSLSGILSDSAFEGLASLRVLYIEGSIFDLQYVKQTNVLGDSDQIILAADTLQTNSDTDWSLAAGSNTLLNNANILDIGEDSKIYVGGEQYSDALLYQANLIEDTSALSAGSPQQLASEAVVFLADDMLETTDQGDEFTIDKTVTEETSVDVLQIMLS